MIGCSVQYVSPDLKPFLQSPGARVPGPHFRRVYAWASLLLFLLCMNACVRQPEYQPAERRGGDIVVQTSALQDGVPRYFSHWHEGIAIRFFVVKTEGKPGAFLDACMKCYPQKLGFRYDNGSVICRACSERYPVSEIEDGVGSCYPIKLGGRAEGGEYRISVADLEKKGGGYFR